MRGMGLPNGFPWAHMNGLSLIRAVHTIGEREERTEHLPTFVLSPAIQSGFQGR